MKKVLFVAPMVSVHELFNEANFQALERMGCKIHVMANFSMDDHTKEYGRTLTRRGIIVHDVPFVRSSLRRNLGVVSIVRKLLKEQHYDMVHCHTETGGIVTRLAMMGMKEKLVFTPHGLSFYEGSSLKSHLIYKPIERWICGKADAVLSVNNEDLNILKKWCGSRAWRIHGVGLRLEDIQNVEVDIKAKKAELGIPDNAKVLISVGELNENKNHQVIVKAFGKVKDKYPEWHYVLCGVGCQKDNLMRLATENGIAERLILTGYRYDVKELYCVADAFAFPSHHEGLSVAMLEAMAAGLPVVCSKVRGNRELISQGENGLLCEPNNVDKFAEYLDMLMENEELRKSMGNENLLRIKQFSLERVSEETEKIYREVLMM